MAYGFPATNNTYIPSFDTTGNLIVDFSRNVKDFAVNKYITLTPVKKMTGYYLRMDNDSPMRVLGSGGDANIWPDGGDRPIGNYNGRQYEFQAYTCERHAFSAQLGYLAVEQSAFDITSMYSKTLGIQAMTLRTKLVDDLFTTSSNYDSTHTGTATALGGGFWSAGTVLSPIIQKTMMAAATVIQKDTAGAVKYTDLALIINPVAADNMARSQELRDYLARSPAALAQVKGDTPGQNAAYGLPDQLYGMKVIVEDATYTAGQYGSNTPTRSFTWGDNSAVICARQGKDLVGVDGQVSFSTVHLMTFQEMSAETFDDSINRRHTLSVTDNYAPVMVAPASGYLITNILS